MHNIFRLRLGIIVHLFAVMVGPGNLFLYIHTCVCNILCRIVSAYRIHIYIYIHKSLSLSIYIYIYICISLSLYTSFSLSLSLYIYIYIHYLLASCLTHKGVRLNLRACVRAFARANDYVCVRYSDVLTIN